MNPNVNDGDVDGASGMAGDREQQGGERQGGEGAKKSGHGLRGRAGQGGWVPVLSFDGMGVNYF